jgi:hypothetical protein
MCSVCGFAVDAEHLAPDEATMRAIFDRVAFAEPDGMELHGDVLWALTQGAIAHGVYLPNKTKRAWLRDNGHTIRRIAELGGRRFMTGLILRDEYTNQG